MRFFRSALVGAVLCALASVSGFAQIVISNPGLPPSEHLVYSDHAGQIVRTLDQTLKLKTEAGQTWYEFSAKAPDADTTVKLDPKTLFTYSIDSTSRTPDSVIRRQTQILQNLHKAGKNELAINDLGTLAVVLRGFPWNTTDYARLVFLGANSASGEFAFELKVQGRQNLVAAGKTWDCWKVEIGLEGFFGAFVGKTTLWFDSATPHVMVKSEGPQGGPGSGVRTLELQSYDAGK